MVFIHYGTEKLNKNYKYDNSKDARQWSRSINKPICCLWSSPIKTNFGWKNFVEEKSGLIHKSLESFVKFKLTKDARVLVISKKTIKSVFKKYGYTYRFWKKFYWDKIEKDYDAVYVDITSLGQGRLSSLVDEYYLNSFDVDSLCVWNLEKVKVV